MTHPATLAAVGETGVPIIPAVNLPPDDARPSYLRLWHQIVSASTNKKQLLSALVRSVEAATATTAIVYLGRGQNGELCDALQLSARGDATSLHRGARQLVASCQAACRSQETTVWQQTSPARAIVAIPVPRAAGKTEALGAIFETDVPPRHGIMLLESVVTQLLLWESQQQVVQQTTELDDCAALLELMTHAGCALDRQTGALLMVQQIRDYLNCQRVILGRRGRSPYHRVAALSDMAKFDPRSPQIRLIEAALDELDPDSDLVTWTASNATTEGCGPALQRLAQQESTNGLVGMALLDTDRQPVGALLLQTSDPQQIDRLRVFLRFASAVLGPSLATLDRIDGGFLSRAQRGIARGLHTSVGKVVMTLCALAGLSLALPIQHRIVSDCQVEPVVRRFVSSPLDGTLEKAFVKPGALVQSGELIAKLDGKELSWQRASLVADRAQAEKKRDSAQATHNYVEQQLATLQMERLDLELKLLDHKIEQLEVRSPVDGIVARGDLERAEGAPLEIGQTLFEISPLEKMIVEVALAEREMSFAREQQAVEIRLDAYPGERWTGVLARIEPRSETRDQQNVFIAEVELDNHDGRLRPGMKGRAKLAGDRRLLGWILFHRPWEYLIKTLCWR